mmetsp:Transcript_13397/g.28150  ORF Transcript_13397/g.28150 Transcript_13397/m.28150 type:complete len:526 (-) Transcript_13397:370-1947(-)|eukprot:CAMPEP_0168169462 /NCGR_PEP_ID=MMETSP0139_2-20121125/3652_1 /TAXON_ID=44445 /ORGANISM="Pseudo-nitzschia australis, Strain 10249 10 AB" /LENGTH=525 /DNA_ID=CAMNT_0008086885 /DNA_START=99 /DNA_END=1676 /DNA_ORIENTATION=-
MTPKSSMILGYVALVVATTALIALFGADPNPAEQDDSPQTTRISRSLRLSNLPLKIVIVNDDYWLNNNGDDSSSRGNDDWWYSGDDYGGDDWWSKKDGENAPHHGGSFKADNDAKADYTFEYKPVDSKFIQITNGGYGGKRGRPFADIRFNKCPPIIDGYRTNAWRYAPSRDYVKGVHTKIFPLMPNDYPLNGEKAIVLKRETMADSIVLPGDFQLRGDDDASYWLDGTGVTPIYPGETGYWDELRTVVEAQIARRQGDSPSSMNTWPAIWEEKTTLEDIAKAVQGEYPGLHQSTMIETLFKEGVEMDRDMSPFRSAVDFIGTDVRLASINTWAFEAVAPVNFMLKWHIGMPRPEEVAWMIYKGQYTSEADGVPEDLVALIQSMNLEHATSFTAYEDGSPMHPSFPAMHSAGSTCSYWIPAICKVTADQYCEVLRVDYAVAYARTIAGVHYNMDNIAGLNIGQRIIREKMPTMLAERYGYDAAQLVAKLEALSFDWNDFDSVACTIGGVSTANFLAKARGSLKRP